MLNRISSLWGERSFVNDRRTVSIEKKKKRVWLFNQKPKTKKQALSQLNANAWFLVRETKERALAAMSVFFLNKPPVYMTLLVVVMLLFFCCCCRTCQDTHKTENNQRGKRNKKWKKCFSEHLSTIEELWELLFFFFWIKKKTQKVQVKREEKRNYLYERLCSFFFSFLIFASFVITVFSFFIFACFPIAVSVRRRKKEV